MECGARREKQREIEGKLFLTGNFRGWNVSENFILEKNLQSGPLDFGYATKAEECVWCPENFRVRVEVYAGLRTAGAFGLADTSHYAAPVVSWELSSGVTLRVSPGFGLTAASAPFLLRFGVAYEKSQFGYGYCHARALYCSGRRERRFRILTPETKALFWVLRNGSRAAGMPSFSQLPDRRLWQIVEYLQSGAPR